MSEPTLTQQVFRDKVIRLDLQFRRRFEQVNMRTNNICYTRQIWLHVTKTYRRSWHGIPPFNCPFNNISLLFHIFFLYLISSCPHIHIL